MTSNSKKSKISYTIEEKNKKTYIYFYKNKCKLIFKDGIHLLMTDNSFRKLVIKILKSMKGSWMWKMTAINNNYDYNRNDKYFKFVIIPSQFHHNNQDDSKFQNNMNDENSVSKNFVFFKSLSGNGLLVPKNIKSNRKSNRKSKSKNEYLHFSNFIKNGNTLQINEFWKTFSILVDKYLTDKNTHKLYINTHGHDVPWLHVRFDTRPEKIIWNT
jgi:hypothetical protein